MAKGAGMLAPALATMLVVLTTDAVADGRTLDRALRAATEVTFDRIDSDGCMSTNDTVLLMASGASGVEPDRGRLTAAVTAACADLARQLLGRRRGRHPRHRDHRRGAATERRRSRSRRAVARSNLFKCAIFGNDPNWGRVLAAVGTTGAAFEPDQLDVTINGVTGLPGRRGRGAAAGRRPRPAARSRSTIDLHAGDASATIWTNDLTHDYVHENSAYST